MFRVIVREHKQVVHVYETMGELAEDRIHHAQECGATVHETERRVMEHISTKRSDEGGLMYINCVYRHLKVSSKQFHVH